MEIFDGGEQSEKEVKFCNTVRIYSFTVSLNSLNPISQTFMLKPFIKLRQIYKIYFEGVKYKQKKI